MRLLLVLALLCWAPPALAIEAGEMFADPAEEARAREIGRQLRCLKCRNQSIFDSNAGFAQDMRNVVRERMVAGDSDDEILSYMYDRFGDYVLLKPRLSGGTVLLWATPVVLLAVAGLGFGAYLRRGHVAGSEETLSSEDRAAARALLERTEG